MKDYDVIVLGSGATGSMLGAILARNSVRTLIVDERSHPRSNADAESVTPMAAALLRTLAERYQVPEFKTLTSFDNCTRIINTSFGVNRHHGFVLHRENTPQNPRETVQMAVQNSAAHLFCQDSDPYLFNTAIRLGCVPRQNYRLLALDVNGAGAVIHGADGTTYRARYLVDTTGRHSPLAQEFGMRDTSPRGRHRSYTQWTHMIDVPMTDAHDRRSHRPLVPWHEGVAYHVFDGGYLWLIPFGNHPQSISKLCSVGLTLDPGKFPPDSETAPDVVFSEIVAKFPSLARQFNGAVPVREWERIDSAPYFSAYTIGKGWALIGPAAGGVDLLFSRGLSDTVEVIHAFAGRLLDAIRNDDFSVERFEYVDRLQQRLLDTSDKLVSSAFASFTDFGMLSAVFRIWAYQMSSGTAALHGALKKHAANPDGQHFSDLEDDILPSALGPGHGIVLNTIDAMADICDSFRRHETSGDRAAHKLGSLVETMALAWTAPTRGSRWRSSRRLPVS